MMILHEWKPIAALILAAGSASLLVATAAPGWVGGPEARVTQGPPPIAPERPSKPFRDPNAPRPSMDSAPLSVPVRISGLVSDPAGKPVAGATVRVFGERRLDVSRLTFNLVMADATATTGADGRYRLPHFAPPTQGLGRVGRGFTPYVEFWVLVHAPGFGFGWHRGSSMYAVPLIDPDDTQGRLPLNSPVEMDVSLRPEVELKWQVVDEAGRPVAGVKVDNRTMLLLGQRGAGATLPIGSSLGLMPPGFGGAVTDADGRFRIAGLPAESCCWLRFRRPDSSMEMMLIASTAAEAQPGPGEPPLPKLSILPRRQVYPAEMTVTMATSRRVDLRVVADDDGTPVPDIVVRTIDRSNLIGVMSGGVTDAGGKLAIDLPPGDYFGLEAYPDSPDSRCVRTELRPLVVAPEAAVQPLEFKMRAGSEVSIEALDADTGRGIPGVRFDIKAEAKGGFWARLAKNASIHSPDGDPTDAAGRLRAILKPVRGESYRVRVAGVGTDLPEAPTNPNIPKPLPLPGAPPVMPEPDPLPRPLPYEVEPEQSEPFEPAPGKPVALRFRLRKR